MCGHGPGVGALLPAELEARILRAFCLIAPVIKAAKFDAEKRDVVLTYMAVN